MTRADRILLATGVLSVAIFTYLAWFSGTYLTFSANLKPFDAHFTGYSSVEGRAYLETLSNKARNQYLGVFRLWDSILPALMAFTLGGFVWTRSGRLRFPVSVLLLVPALGYMAMDYAENVQVAHLLRSRQVGLIPDDAVHLASFFTRMKWGLLILSILVSLFAAVFGRRR